MEFKNLNKLEQLQEIEAASFSKPQVLFKHSTRCSVSSMAKRILSTQMQNTADDLADIYYLDLIEHREISNAIASKFNVFHESPQILLIKNGKCVFDASHSDVSLTNLLPSL
jgi:bacillithiol system protein YtxJ